MFPEWFYELIWGRQYVDSGYWLDGLDYWLTDHPFWFYIGVTAAVVLVVLACRRRARFFSSIDRFAWRIIASSLAALVITLLIVRIYATPCLPAGQFYALAYELTLKEVQAVPLNPTIHVPVDFHYLDSERVKALYNEIDQDLVEQQRTVGSIGKMSGKIGGKAGPAEAEIGGSKEQSSSSTYQRLEFSPERKCVEVMNYVLKGNNSKYFTTIDDWLRRKQAANFQARYNAILNRGLSTAQATTPSVLGDTPRNPTKDEQEAAEHQLEENRTELKSELASLDGLLFLEGDFAIAKTSSGTIVLMEKFSEIPRVSFRVTASGAPGLNEITPSGRAHLKVFGTVVRPLVRDAPVEVRAIAVF